jgi:hypothetical protein
MPRCVNSSAICSDDWPHSVRLGGSRLALLCRLTGLSLSLVGIWFSGAGAWMQCFATLLVFALSLRAPPPLVRLDITPDSLTLHDRHGNVLPAEPVDGATVLPGVITLRVGGGYRHLFRDQCPVQAFTLLRRYCLGTL